MIKFFRRIRQDMIKEKKASNYLLYAVGEVVLVVIGILIALQINNWNENRKTDALAKSYLSDIKKDLIADTVTFTNAINRLNRTISNSELLLNTEITNSLPLDSLFSLVRISFHSTRIYHINNVTYLKMSNTGFLESGLFNSVFSDINTYYNKEYVAYTEYIEWDEEQTIDILHTDFLGTHKNVVDFSSIVSEGRDAFDSQVGKKVKNSPFREFVNSIEFRNHVWANYIRKEIVLERILIQKEIATRLIDKIKVAVENE